MNVLQHMGGLAAGLHRDGLKVALATVLGTWGSSPRPVGAQLVVCEDGSFHGSVSGGCVEGAVVLEALEVLTDGKCKLLEYGVADADAFAVGLACGGTIKIMVEPVGFGQGIAVATLDTLAQAETLRQAIGLQVNLENWERAVITPQTHPEGFGSLGGVAEKIYTHIQNPPLRLVLIGAVHIAQFLAPMAQMAGYHVTIVDPRESFASPQRFADHELIIDWPEDALAGLTIDDRTAMVTLTHDAKMDTPSLQAILETDAFYVGALGSSRTHAKRRLSMMELGVSAKQFDRIQGPVGLPIGSKSPAEIALSILAEITQCLRMKSP
jgi:xanthine dehydrogenase accessory factor